MVFFQSSTRTDDVSPKFSDVSSTLHGNNFPYVRVGDLKVYVEVADDDAERARGLSGRESLPADWGMLFVFERPGVYSFWMYEMRFPLDIIWINETLQVAFIVENAPPCTMLTVCSPYVPNVTAKYVLEINAGLVEKYGIKVGERVVFPPGLTD